MNFLGIEIGGTKLQLGIGSGDGVLKALWRDTVNVQAGPEGIRRQIERGFPQVLDKAKLQVGDLKSIGIGFGGPVDDSSHTIIKSHQIAGWDGFPLESWIADMCGIPAVLGNDADCAGLAEALFGAGKGLSPLFYITIGSGIGGGLVIDGQVQRGCGRGAAEFGHMKILVPSDREGKTTLDYVTLESVASGWGMEEQTRKLFNQGSGKDSTVWQLVAGDPRRLSTQILGHAARKGDSFALEILHQAYCHLAHALCQVICLICPRRIVIGGGVSLLGEDLFFSPLTRLVKEQVFVPFAGLSDIVPAALGEEVVVHGALAMARQRWGQS